MKTYRCELILDADIHDAQEGQPVKLARTWTGRRLVELPFAPRKGMRLRGFIDIPLGPPDGEDHAEWCAANCYAVFFGGDPHQDGEELGWEFPDPPVYDVARGVFVEFVTGFTVSVPPGWTTESLTARFPGWLWEPSTPDDPKEPT